MHERERETEKDWWLHVGEVTQAFSGGIEEFMGCVHGAQHTDSCSEVLTAKKTLLASTSANTDFTFLPRLPRYTTTIREDRLVSKVTVTSLHLSTHTMK